MCALPVCSTLTRGRDGRATKQKDVTRWFLPRALSSPSPLPELLTATDQRRSSASHCWKNARAPQGMRAAGVWHLPAQSDEFSPHLSSTAPEPMYDNARTNSGEHERRRAPGKVGQGVCAAAVQRGEEGGQEALAQWPGHGGRVFRGRQAHDGQAAGAQPQPQRPQAAPERRRHQQRRMPAEEGGREGGQKKDKGKCAQSGCVLHPFIL